jgi:hypothetical protein
MSMCKKMQKDVTHQHTEEQLSPMLPDSKMLVYNDALVVIAYIIIK